MSPEDKSVEFCCILGCKCRPQTFFRKNRPRTFGCRRTGEKNWENVFFRGQVVTSFISRRSRRTTSSKLQANRWNINDYFSFFHVIFCRNIFFSAQFWQKFFQFLQVSRDLWKFLWTLSSPSLAGLSAHSFRRHRRYRSKNFLIKKLTETFWPT